MRLILEDIVRAVGGSLVAGASMPSGPVVGAGTDSRAVAPGSLFVCIPCLVFAILFMMLERKQKLKDEIRRRLFL